MLGALFPQRLEESGGVTQQGVERNFEQFRKILIFDLAAIDSELLQGTAIGGNQFAISGETGNGLIEGADELGPIMETQHQFLVEARGKQLVFDYKQTSNKHTFKQTNT